MLTACLVAALPLLLGFPLMLHQSENALETRAMDASRFALNHIETMLDSANLAANAVSQLAGKPCAEAERALRLQATSRPFVRSVNLTENGVIYCTSLNGSVRDAEEADAYAGGHLRLMAGNDVTPDRAVLIYRLPEKSKSVLVGIDGQHLKNILRLVSAEFATVSLLIGNSRMERDGSVSEVTPNRPSVRSITASSKKYPFTMQAANPDGMQLRFLIEHYLPQLGLLALLGTLAGFGTYKLGLRALSPRVEMGRALSAGEFVPYYQPLVRGDDYEWCGLEVLMRWTHPTDGLIPADLFIPYAERSGLIVPMTEHLMAQTCRELAPHAKRLPPDFHIGINVSAAHCMDLRLIDQCRQFLSAFPVGSIVLVLELTERELIEPTDVTDRLFAELRGLGVKIAIDDFGTGQSSLAYLQKFHIDALKIDRSFVAMAGSDVLSRHILDNIIDLANRLNLDVVAEGIENTQQRDYLSQRGVQYLQGYFFGRPMPVDPLLRTLEQASPK